MQILLRGGPSGTRTCNERANDRRGMPRLFFVFFVCFLFCFSGGLRDGASAAGESGDSSTGATDRPMADCTARFPPAGPVAPVKEPFRCPASLQSPSLTFPFEPDFTRLVRVPSGCSGVLILTRSYSFFFFAHSPPPFTYSVVALTNVIAYLPVQWFTPFATTYEIHYFTIKLLLIVDILRLRSNFAYYKPHRNCSIFKLGNLILVGYSKVFFRANS